jgi:hypothetical protein
MNLWGKLADRHPAVVLMSLLAVVLVALLAPTLRTGFLSDDFLDLHHDFGPSSFTKFEAGGFRPLTVAIWALDAHLWGSQRAYGWHATNLALHLLNTILMLLLLRQLGFGGKSALWGALFFAVSWAAMPSAARVSGRTTMIALAPMLLALALHAAWLRRGGFSRLIASGALFLASMLAKETMLLCAPLFGFLSLYIRRDERRVYSFFAKNSAVFLIPTIAYALWRLAWMGPILSYGESLSIGPFMIRNLARLAAMPLSPWLDALPARLLLLSGVVLFLIMKASWRSKVFAAALLVLPLATVLNLPPRSDFAYAALPAATTAIAAIATRARGWRGTAGLGVLIIGCALSARDEVGRLSVASALAESEIDRLATLNQENPGNEFIFLSGVDYDTAGYGTLWPNAFTEALSTRGIFCDRFRDVGVLWETLYPSIDAGERPRAIIASFDARGEAVLRFDTCSRLWDGETPEPCRVGPVRDELISLPDSLRIYNACFVWPAGPEVELLLQNPFDPCSLIAIEPSDVHSDTACFDLESRPEWLLGVPSGLLIGFRGLNSLAVIEFTMYRPWLVGLGERLAEKSRHE